VSVLAIIQFSVMVIATLVCASAAALLSVLGLHRAAYVPVLAWAWTLLVSTGVRYRVHGLDNVPRPGSYVVISNHCSHLDGPTIALALPHPVYFVIKRELSEIPLWGLAARKLGFIAVDRSDSVHARAQMLRAVETVRDGRRVLVFAEGTRSPDGHLQRFKKGGFHLAIDAQVPILPVTVNGSHALFPKGGASVRQGTLDVIVGRAIPTAGLGKEHIEELMATTRQEILEARRQDPDFIE
jgi:1-acyl-sn-glycerol-3-phosphate acyltransferase